MVQGKAAILGKKKGNDEEGEGEGEHGIQGPQGAEDPQGEQGPQGPPGDDCPNTKIYSAPLIRCVR
jgi:hypothetical protein